MSSISIYLYIIVIHLIPVKPSCVLQEHGVTGYLQKADIIIGGVFPLHINHGIQLETFQKPPAPHDCQGFSFRSFRWMLAFLFAVEEVNQIPGTLSNITLGAAVIDSCSDARQVLEEVSWLISGVAGGPLNYQCWYPPLRLLAVLGDGVEDSALSLASILRLYNFPQISYYTPPEKFSNHYLFPSTLSIAPTFSSQARGLARLLQRFGWMWIGVLSQETSAATLGQTFMEEVINLGICLAFWEHIPTSINDVKRVADVIRQSTVKVVVVICLEAYLNPVLIELAQNGVGKPRIWISITTWSTYPRLVAPWLSNFLTGTVGLALHSGDTPGFKEFVCRLDPRKYNQPLFFEFWEEAFGCCWPREGNQCISISNLINDSSKPITPPTTSVRPLCTGTEDLGSLNIFSEPRVAYSIYKAVKMAVKALQDMVGQENKKVLQDETQFAHLNFKPQKLFYYLRRVRIKGNDGDDIYFDSLGNVPSNYDLVNWQEGPTGVSSWVKVGSYESGAIMGQDLFINQSAIQWGKHFDQPPTSVCSENCPPGFWKARHPDRPQCCFDCIPCAAGAISNHTNAIACFDCPEDEWPNTARNQCVLREVELLTFTEPLGISLGTTSIFGSLLPALVLILFIKNRKTPLVCANNQTLSFILLIALLLSFLCPVLLLIRPGHWSCFVRQAAFGVIFTLCISCILVKTLTVVLAFHAQHPGGCLKVPKGPCWSILFIAHCTAIQIILCQLWYLIDPPFVFEDRKSLVDKIIIQCGDKPGFWFMLGYLKLLSAICFVVAFLARKLPETFNETTHITFSMLVFLCVWISFVPVYLSVHGKIVIVTEIFAILCSSAGLFFCIFSPKVYIILLKPQLNCRAMIYGHKGRMSANNLPASSYQQKDNFKDIKEMSKKPKRINPKHKNGQML